MDKQHDKRITRARRRLQSGNTYQLTQNNTKKVSNWKTPGYDEIHGFWFKKLTSIYERLALEMNRCLQEPHEAKLMTKGKTTLIQKIYSSLTNRGLFPEEQKGCHKGSRGTAELLYIDQHIQNESKTKRKKTSWIDYKKAYDIIPGAGL